MLLPRGKHVWLNLSTEFVEIDKLILFLKQDKFTGLMHFIFAEAEGMVLFHEGDAMSGLMELENERKSGQNAINDILRQARQDMRGRINISEYPEETISILSDTFSMNVKRVYENLSSEFSHLGKFFMKLKEEKFTGYVEMRFPADRRSGIEIIQLDKGKVSAVITRNLQLRVIEGDSAAIKDIGDYIKISQEAGVRYSAFEAI